MGEMGRSSTFSVGWPLTDRTWLVSSLSNWERKAQLYLWELQKLYGPVVLWNAMEHMFDPWWRRWFMMECLMT